MKVAFCVPIHSRPETRFVAAMFDAALYSLQHLDGINIRRFFVSSSELPTGRMTLVSHALQWDAEYMLCLDADHTFPPDALVRLLAHGVEVVGCNYRQRHPPHAPTAMRDGIRIETNGSSPVLERVNRVGLGLCLIKMSTLRRMLAQPNSLPFFTGSDKGEDYIFFEKLAAAGAEVFVDSRLSMEVGHITEQVITL